MAPDARAAAGISDGLLRLSIGIEALEDLREDLDDALARVAALQPLACGGTSPA
jgi:cystathionine gamma-synthase